MISLLIKRSRPYWVAAGFVLLWAPPLFSANVYHWTDEKGTAHFTDDIAKVPLQYRDRVKTSEFPEGPSEADEQRVEPEEDESSERVRRYLEEIERKIEIKKGLELSISKLEEERSVCENRIQEIERYEREYFNYYQPVKDPRTGRWVPVGSPYYDEKRRLAGRIEAIQKELALLEEKLLEVVRSL
jgi:DNA repair exonuclease SbcCD ATPase subunit